MPTLYSVVQYVPDPLTGERINIGIVALGAAHLAAKFVTDWSRVECFAGGRDISFLHEIAAQVVDADPDQLGIGQISGFEELSADLLFTLSKRWHNSVQFTPPAPSMSDPETLLEKLAPRFLRTVGASRFERREHHRTRSTAARIAQRSLEKALQLTQLEATVHKRADISGRLETYRFDAVAEHVSPLAVTHGLSFEGVDEEETIRTVDAFGQAIRDVREAHPHLPIGVVALVRQGVRAPQAYSRAIRIFENYGAAVLHEDEVVGWAEHELVAANKADEDLKSDLQIFPDDEQRGKRVA